MYKNPKVINELGGIVMEAIEDGEPDRYLDPELDATEHKLVMKGKYGAVAPFTPPSKEEILEQLNNEARAKRKQLLETIVDPVVSNPLRWNDLTSDQQQAYKDYRQALLDITDQDGYPETIEWPTLGV